MNQARGHDQRFTPLGRARATRPQATAFERSYLGTMEQVREVSETGDVMPQKSTYFYPKIIDGLGLQLLDGESV